MSHPRDRLLRKLAADLGLDPSEEIVALPKYELTVEHDGQLFVSGQIPRVGVTVAVAVGVGVAVGRTGVRVAVGVGITGGG